MIPTAFLSSSTAGRSCLMTQVPKSASVCLGANAICSPVKLDFMACSCPKGLPGIRPNLGDFSHQPCTPFQGGTSMEATAGAVAPCVIVTVNDTGEEPGNAV